MALAASEPGSDFFVRALVVVAAAGVLHFGLAHALLVLVAADASSGVPHGRELVSLAVVAALLAQLGALYLRSQHGDPADVVRAVPKALPGPARGHGDGQHRLERRGRVRPR